MISLLDCTLRDGGYYNNWDFNNDLVQSYLVAMSALKVDYIEIGFRTTKNENFKGAYAFSTDEFLRSLRMPNDLIDKIGVMVNGSELSNPKNQVNQLEKLFVEKKHSPVTLVRIACHVKDFIACLPVSNWLVSNGYKVGFNLMQVADSSLDEITELAVRANDYPIDVLYFADSMGSLNPEQIAKIVKAFKEGWTGDLGIHTHDNMGNAIVNSLAGIESGVSWVDSTITGMGRGPGNAQTEYIVLATQKYRDDLGNPTKLFDLVRSCFKSLQVEYGWGTNPYYYLAGLYGIHPSYIQEMLQDSRYSDEDMIAVIEHLRIEGGKKFSLHTLEASRYFYSGELKGSWEPKSILQNREVMVIGSGPSVMKYKSAIEDYIQRFRPYVIALNTESSLEQKFVDARAACHPVRLLADCHQHLNLPQPLITPYSMSPKDVQDELANKKVLDYGLLVEPNNFKFSPTYCVLPTSLVVSYVLALANSGAALEIKLVGFDGYSADDARSAEMEHLLKVYDRFSTIPLCSLTPTRYDIPTKSIFGF